MTATANQISSVVEVDALLTDRYTMPMSQSFWLHGQGEERVNFDLFVRRLPDTRRYLVSVGLAPIVQWLQALRFTTEDLDYLASLGPFHEGFLEYLSDWRFTGDVDAVAEGTVIGAQAPSLAMSARRIDATIIESALLATSNHQTMVASKAARMVEAAKGRPEWDMSLRRLHGVGAANGVARAAYIAGFAGTATLAAGRDLGIPTTGTMAHHYVQRFGPEREQEAFEQFLRDNPDNGVLLVDAYDTIRGIERAIAAGKATGIQPKGIRLDSGDLLADSFIARRMLDDAGYQTSIIIASNDLDEYKIALLIDAGAPIDSFGIGTMLGTSADAPNLGGVYKLTAQDVEEDDLPQLVMKLAPDKMTDPGNHQLWRVAPGADILTLREEQPPASGAVPLLEPVMRDGEVVAELPSIEDARVRCAEQIAELPMKYRELEPGGPQLTVHRSVALTTLREQLTVAA